MKKLLLAISGFLAGVNVLFAQAPTISYSASETYVAGQAITPLMPTSSGVNNPGYGSPGTVVSVTTPAAVGIDAAGNLYVVDATDLKFYKIPAGSSTPVSLTDLYTNGSYGVTADAAGNVYVSDSGGIHAFSPAGLESTFFVTADRIAADNAGNLYAMSRFGDLFKMTTTGDNATVIASGFTNSSGYDASTGLATDAAGDVCVVYNGVVQIIPVVGSPGTLNFGINNQKAIKIDAENNIYITTTDNTLYKIPSDGSPTAMIASGFNNPADVATDSKFNVYVADYASNAIKKVKPAGGYFVSPVLPQGLVFNSTTGAISGTPTGGSAPANYTIIAYNSFGSATATIAINVTTATISYTNPPVYTKGKVITPLVPQSNNVPAPAYSASFNKRGLGFTNPLSVATDDAGNIYVADHNTNEVKEISPGSNIPFNIGSGFITPTGVAVDAAGNVYVADAGNNLVKKIPHGTGTPVSIGAGFNAPAGVAVDAAGNVFVADYGNNAIKKIRISDGVTVGLGSGFLKPQGVAVDAAGNIYVADAGNNAIKKMPAAGGTPTAFGAGFVSPAGVWTDAAGNVYIADTGNNMIKEIGSGGVSLIIGSAFSSPGGVTTDGAGNVYVADSGNNLIKEYAPTGGFYINTALPDGLNFDQTTGTVNGIPTVTSNKNYVVNAYNSFGGVPATIKITVQTPVTLTWPTPPP